MIDRVAAISAEYTYTSTFTVVHFETLLCFTDTTGPSEVDCRHS
jgi:hypothetical protein